jgi:glycosyltransferase involved in cell wall biosynthesis
MKAGLPTVSVITITYNNASGLAKTLASIAAQDYPKLEQIVVDGGSKDNTLAVMTEYAHLIKRSVSEPDKGIYDAMNKGMAMASGEFLWFLNAGDVAHSPTVLTQIFTLPIAKTPTDEWYDVYYGEAINVNESYEPSGTPRRKALPAKLTHRSMSYGMVVCHQSMIVRRRIAPLYDLQYKYSGDVDWAIRLLRRTESVCNTGLVIADFLEGGVSTARRKASLLERFAILRKHFGLPLTVWRHAGFVWDTARKGRVG